MVAGLAGVGVVDRVLLDLLDPWTVIPVAAGALAPGGSLVAFVATVPQVMRTVEALKAARAFGLVETAEAILRPWHVEGLAVRPEHRMIGHTGFLVGARRVERSDEPAAGAGAAGSAAQDRTDQLEPDIEPAGEPVEDGLGD